MKYTGFVNSKQGLVSVEAIETGVTSIAFVSAPLKEQPFDVNAPIKSDVSEMITYSGGVQGGHKEQADIKQGEFLGDKARAYSNEITDEACRQLKAYFEGELREFDLPLAPKGTVFQNQVWRALQQVKYGETASYLDIAKAIGNPKAVRAVGMANGRNPIAIVVPCHRIIGSNKSLTGYAGGLPRKQYLLNLEGAQGVLWS